VSLPGAEVPANTEGPLTLEQRLAISRQRELEAAQAAPAAPAAPETPAAEVAPVAPADSPVEQQAPAGGEEESKAGGSENPPA
jgi:hypothetical protein